MRTNAINESYRDGTLTTNLKTGIIRLLRKGQKDPTLTENHRPISLLSIPSCHFPNFLSLWQIFVDTHSVCTHLLREGASQSSVCCSSVLFSLLSSVTYCVRMPFLALETIGPITKGLLSSTPSLSHSLFPHVCIILHYAFSPFFSVPSSSLFFALTIA